MPKFWITCFKNDEKVSFMFTAESREAAENELTKDGCTAVYASTLAGHLDSLIRQHIQKLKISEQDGYEADKWNAVRKAEVEQRLRCCADAAYMFGEDSQESLERTLGRAVDCKWEITGLDGHMFSFGFKSPAGFHGGIIFHCSAKDWASHT